MIKIKKFEEALSDDDQRLILDFEQDIAEVKKQKIDASSPEEKEDLDFQIEDIKKKIQDIKDAAQ